jgi:hypothetical protein
MYHSKLEDVRFQIYISYDVLLQRICQKILRLQHVALPTFVKICCWNAIHNIVFEKLITS